MTIESHIGLETSTSLLHAYDSVALQHQRMRKAESWEVGKPAVVPSPPPMTFDRYATTFTLLSLNAAIVEGTMRSILADRILKNRLAAIDEANRQGRTVSTSAERLVETFHLSVETNGGWENLKAQYAEYLGIKMLDLVPTDKGTTLQTAEVIESLFVLRNVVAHGTAFVIPKEWMDDNSRENYPYKWQSKLQRASVLLKCR